MGISQGHDNQSRILALRIRYSHGTYLVNCVVLGQREIFESLRIEFFAEGTGLKLSVMKCQSCGSSKVIGTEVHPSCNRHKLPTWVGIRVGWIRSVLHAQLGDELLGSAFQFIGG